MSATSYFRGHKIRWEGPTDSGRWVYEDTGQPVPSPESPTEAKAFDKTAAGHFRGHKTRWDEQRQARVYADGGEPLPGYGGNARPRPCKECGETFPLGEGEVDPCLGVLPGVDNACCGHGVPSSAYIRFTTGVVVRGFEIEIEAECNQ